MVQDRYVEQYNNQRILFFIHWIEEYGVDETKKEFPKSSEWINKAEVKLKRKESEDEKQ